MKNIKSIIVLAVLAMALLLQGCSSDTTLEKYKLTIGINGSGTGTVTPNGGTYEYGEKVKVTAEAADGSTFKGWQGAGYDGNTNPTITVIMDSDVTLIAVFEEVVGGNTGGSIEPKTLYDFEDGVDGWNVKADWADSEVTPQVSTDWSAEGSQSLAANVTFDGSQYQLIIYPYPALDLSSYSTLSVTVKSTVSGAYSKLYVKDGTNWEYYSVNAEGAVSDEETTFTIDLSDYDYSDNIREIGIEFMSLPEDNSTGTLYIDNIIGE